MRYGSTIGAERACNVQRCAMTEQDAFLQMRKSRDAELQAPRLLFQSVQVNINAGRLPKAQVNGMRHLPVPLNLKRQKDDAGLPAPPPETAG